MHAGMAAAAEVSSKFDEFHRWGTMMNPYIDLSTPATEEEKKAGAGMLALAAGG